MLIQPDNKHFFGSLQLPQGTSALTAAPTTDLTTEKWVTLHTVPTHAPYEAFWYVIKDYTINQHWNRSIYNVSKTAEEWVDSSTATIIDPSHFKKRDKSYILSPGQRYQAIRTLSRKAPAPVGGGEKGDQPTRQAVEWTVQYIRDDCTDCQDCNNNNHLTEMNQTCADSDCDLNVTVKQKEKTAIHTAIFGLCIPQSVHTESNPRAQRYWPFQYPKVRCYRFTYEEIGMDADANGNERNDETSNDTEKPSKRGLLKYEVVPLGEDAKSPREFDKLKEHSKNTAIKMLTQLRKRLEKFDPAVGESTYKKRVVHDNLVTEEAFRQRYDQMKVKYNFWVDKWTECTDPVKFVYEELSIAAYLCVLWEKEREEEGFLRKQTFIDCGCGNGFLVYLLISEGHEGIGVDLQKRKIWDIYPEKVTKCLLQEEMNPETYDCSQFDWIVGNHSDELSPWIPVMAARAQHDFNKRPCCDISGETLAEEKPSETLRRAYPRFFVLPCCFYDFDGKKVSFGQTRRTLGVRAGPGTGKYEQYYRWIAQIAKAFGFTVEYENLRIPSTKYVSILGRFIQYEQRISPAVIREMTALLLLDAQQSHS